MSKISDGTCDLNLVMLSSHAKKWQVLEVKMSIKYIKHVDYSILGIFNVRRSKLEPPCGLDLVGIIYKVCKLKVSMAS